MQQDRITSLDYFTDTIVIPGENGTARSHQLAGSGARFLAGLFDLLLQVIGFIVIAWVAITYRPEMFPPKSWPWAGPVAFVEWHIIYLMLFESFTRGTTPGKAILRLRVVSIHGKLPGPTAIVIRNICRILDLALLGYGTCLLLVSGTRRRQRLGDRIAGTCVVYAIPLTRQLDVSLVPESLYSTSEDGYLLQAWTRREYRFDEESRVASATDLAAYLHSRYRDEEAKSKDPVSYLHDLHEAEMRANE